MANMNSYFEPEQVKRIIQQNEIQELINRPLEEGLDCFWLSVNVHHFFFKGKMFIPLLDEHDGYPKKLMEDELNNIKSSLPVIIEGVLVYDDKVVIKTAPQFTLNSPVIFEVHPKSLAIALYE